MVMASKSLPTASRGWEDAPMPDRTDRAFCRFSVFSLHRVDHSHVFTIKPLDRIRITRL